MPARSSMTDAWLTARLTPEPRNKHAPEWNNVLSSSSVWKTRREKKWTAALATKKTYLQAAKFQQEWKRISVPDDKYLARLVVSHVGLCWVGRSTGGRLPTCRLLLQFWSRSPRMPLSYWPKLVCLTSDETLVPEDACTILGFQALCGAVSLRPYSG